jgi:hypothetical protein
MSTTVLTLDLAPPDAWVRIRDKIQIDATLDAQMGVELAGMTPGVPLYLLAREITHEPGYVWKVTGHEVVLVCDSYVAHGGQIDTSGASGTDGPPGKAGKNGTRSADQSTGTAGAQGEPGIRGGDGTSASPITIFAQSCNAGALIANGGNPGNGGAGGRGGDGITLHTHSTPGRPVLEFLDGGDGGNGGDAGKPGNGAAITVFSRKQRPAFSGFSWSAYATVMPSAAAGIAGIGGSPGTGGRAGGNPGQPQAASGVAGASTAAGVSGAVAYTTVMLNAPWADAFAAVPFAFMQDWADYRQRVGEYLFRSHVAASDPTAQLKDQATAEFQAVLGMRSNNRRAPLYLAYLRSGLTPIGLPYDYDLQPKFPAFEAFITDYSEMGDFLYSLVAKFLKDASDWAAQKQALRTNVDFYKAMGDAALTDQKIAVGDAAQAQQRLDYAKSQIQVLGTRLDVLAEARKNQPMTFMQFVATLAEVVVAVAGIVGAVMTAGASLAATAAAIGLLAKDTITLANGNLIDNSDPTSPKLTVQGNKEVGDIQSLVKGTASFIKAAEGVYELVNSTLKQDPLAPEPQVLGQQVQATFDVAMANFALQHAALAKQGADQRFQANTAAKNSLDALLKANSSTMTHLVNIARALLAQFQVYNDLFIRYHFFANRAFDLYTLASSPRTADTRFTYGYVNPDQEADAFAALTRGDLSAFVQVDNLLASYQQSLAGQLLIATRSDYDDYDRFMVASTHVWRVTAVELLEALRNRDTVIVTTHYADLAAAPAELKILHVAVGLVGAKSGVTIADVRLRHPGSATNRRLNETDTIAIMAPPREMIVGATLAKVEAEDLTAAAGATTQPWWGRSPITAWQLTIVSPAADLDLSGLTEVQLGVEFVYNNPSSHLKKPPPRGRRPVPPRPTPFPVPPPPT